MGQIIEYRTEESQHVQQIPDADPVANIQEAEGDPQPFVNHKYFIGLPCLYDDYYLGMTNIRATTYFDYNHDDVHEYLRQFSCIYVPKSQPVEIMKTDFTIEYVGGYPTYQIVKNVLVAHIPAHLEIATAKESCTMITPASSYPIVLVELPFFIAQCS